MTPLVLTGIVLSGLMAGAFVDAVGVGGVLLTPLLLAFTPFDLKVIMAAASFSFVFTGLVRLLSTVEGRASFSGRTGDNAP